jgi:small-conductance mechanosensitive channel
LSRAITRLAFALLLLAVAAAAALAEQNGAARQFNQLVDEWRRTLDQVQSTLGNGDLTRDHLDELRGRVDIVHQAAERARAEADGQRKPLNDQLAALGPAPAKGQPAESPEVARQRKQLQEQVAGFDARIKQAELTIARANGLLANISQIANRQIAERLLEREKPPLSLGELTAAAQQFGAMVTALAGAPATWWRSSTISALEPANLGWLAFIGVLALVAGWPLRVWLLRRYGHRLDLAEPSYARRALAAAVEGVARGLLPAAGLLAFAGTLFSFELVSGLFADIVTGVLGGIIFFSLTSALARAALSPDATAWRIVPFSAEASRTLGRRLTVLAGMAAIGLGIGLSTRELRAGAPDFFNVFGLIYDTIAVALTLTLLQARLWQPDGAAPAKAETPPAGPVELGVPKPGSAFWPTLRVLLRLTLLAVPVLSLLGYHNLAGHLLSRTVMSGVLVGALLLVRTLLRELLAQLIDPASPRSARLRHMLSLSDSGGQILLFWLAAALDLVLILLGVALGLGLWGVPSQAIGAWTGSILRGVTIGNLKISLGEIVMAVVVFAGFWAGTRLLQRLLTDKLLPQTRLDPGVRHSFSAMVGYVGFVIAAAFAISTLGLSLSNIAIIAGALSVGIGFGLQNIVNNFVSGLILLIERPIKVGDWVVVGQHQGYVTRISVRATEIQTFERASVIVPNSELLSGAVVNWTHRDKYGRVDVTVGAAYGSDTAKVREVLLGCARENRQILSWPAPYVLFREFGDSALGFELRGYIADVEQRAFVTSDLHFAIERAFREAGIEMPFPQRDLNIRNLAELAAALAASRGDGAAASAMAAAPLAATPIVGAEGGERGDSPRRRPGSSASA